MMQARKTYPLIEQLMAAYPELGVIVKVGGGNGMPFTVIVIGKEDDVIVLLFESVVSRVT